MRKGKIETHFLIFDSLEELPQSDKELMVSAKEALSNSYSPYSNFKVGAAVLMQDGKIYAGSNQENAAYPLCLCAERVTLSTADSQSPKIPILSIAITVKNSKGMQIEFACLLSRLIGKMLLRLSSRKLRDNWLKKAG